MGVGADRCADSIICDFVMAQLCTAVKHGAMGDCVGDALEVDE